MSTEHLDGLLGFESRRRVSRFAKVAKPLGMGHHLVDDLLKRGSTRLDPADRCGVFECGLVWIRRRVPAALEQIERTGHAR